MPPNQIWENIFVASWKEQDFGWFWTDYTVCFLHHNKDIIENCFTFRAGGAILKVSCFTNSIRSSYKWQIWRNMQREFQWFSCFANSIMRSYKWQIWKFMFWARRRRKNRILRFWGRINFWSQLTKFSIFFKIVNWDRVFLASKVNWDWALIRPDLILKSLIGTSSLETQLIGTKSLRRRRKFLRFRG